MDAIRLTDLRRTYLTARGIIRPQRVERQALRGVSFSVERGELFGLLGPNGAGKTTLVKILATVLLPTSGRVEIFGRDVVRETPEVRRRIGLVFGGERGLYGSMTARDTLHFWGALYRLSSADTRHRTDELLALLGLERHADDRVWTYSRGMKQRLHLARGLLARPDLLLLDEPTLGLDPVAANALRQIVRDLREQGMTIFLTTHYMAEAEALCDRVAFINEGRVELLDQPRALTRIASEVRRVDTEIGIARADRGVSEIRALPGVRSVVPGPAEDEWLPVAIECDDGTYGALLEVLARYEPRTVNTREPSLEDVYLKVLGARAMAV